MIAPKYKSSEAGNSNMPKSSHTVIPLSDKEKSRDLKGKKKSYAAIAKI